MDQQLAGGGVRISVGKPVRFAAAQHQSVLKILLAKLTLDL